MTDDPLIIDDDDRYARFRLIAWWEQEKLAAAKILVVGAGALGNEVLKNLAMLGVGRIWLIDFDRIEESNLTRTVLFRSRDRGRPKAQVAAEALADLNPETKVYPQEANVITAVGLGLFRDVDVVIGCLDNREARLWVNRCCWKTGTPWIDGGIQEINGVVKVFQPPDGACYECAMTENDYRLINLRYSCPLLKQEDILAGRTPTAPTISSMIGGMQTQEALKLIHGMPTTVGEAMVFNGAANNFYRSKFQRREDCLSHETYGEPIETPLSAAGNTVAELLQFASDESGAQAEAILLDRDLVTALVCHECKSRRDMMKAQADVSMKDAICPHCGGPERPDMEHEAQHDGPWSDRTLAEIGVPAYDMVRVRVGDDERIYLLGGDRDTVIPPL